MHTQQAFVQAILEQPDDDAVRLVYADWLDEHDEPERAEFIRVQVQLAKLDEDHPKYWELTSRQDELLVDHAASWVQPFADILVDDQPLHDLIAWGRFRRGFLADVRARPSVFIAQAEKLFHVLPLDTLFLEIQGEDIHDLAACRWMARLANLFAGNGLDAQRLAALLASPHLPRALTLHCYPEPFGPKVISLLSGHPAACRVRSLGVKPARNHPAQFQQLAATSWDELALLTLHGEGVDDAGIEQLARSAQFSRLTTLNFRDCNQISPAGWQSLVQSEHLTPLQSMTFEGCKIGEAGWRELGQAANWKALKYLTLSDSLDLASVRHIMNAPWMLQLHGIFLSRCSLTDASLAELVASPNFVGIRRLSVLTNPDMGDAALVALAKSRYADGLIGLTVMSENITAVGVQALADSGNLKGIRDLDLSCCRMGSAGMTVLARSRQLSGVRHFSASLNQVGDEAVQALTKANWLGRIEMLNLSSNHISNRGVQALADSAGLARLRRLDLNFNEIGDAGAEALAQSPSLSRLAILKLTCNPIGEAGAIALAQSPYLGRLCGLELSRNNISKKGHQALKDRFGSRLVLGS